MNLLLQPSSNDILFLPAFLYVKVIFYLDGNYTTTSPVMRYILFPFTATDKMSMSVEEQILNLRWSLFCL